ncbi:O-antigen ligase family protein [Acidaminobacterium chupaoyuni]
MQKTVDKLEKFFWLFLFINPFLDIGNGIFISAMEEIKGLTWEQIGLPVTPSLVIRMVVLLLFGAYIIMQKDKKAFRAILPIGAAWLLSVIGEVIWPPKEFALFTDIQYVARFGYNVVILFVYWSLFRHSRLSKNDLLKKLNSIITFTLTVLSSSILIAYIFGAGYTTYADRFSLRGSRGFFYSGNDITAILMALLPIAMCTFMTLVKKGDNMKRSKQFYYAYAPAATLTTLFVIGTKTAFLSAGVSVVALTLWALVKARKTKDYTLLKRIGIILLIAFAILLILAIVSTSNVFADISESMSIIKKIKDETGGTNALMSGRQNKLAHAFKDYRNGGVYKWLFGVSRGSQIAIIEMDIMEVFCYYGLFGLVCFLLPYVSVGVAFLRRFFRSRDLFSFAVFLALGLCAGYLFIAGHILFSVTSGFYFSLLLLYGKLIYSDDYQNETL